MSTDEPQCPQSQPSPSRSIVVPLFAAPVPGTPADPQTHADGRADMLACVEALRAGLLNGTYTGFQLMAGTTLANPSAVFIKGSYASKPDDAILLTTAFLQRQVFALRAANAAVNHTSPASTAESEDEVAHAAR